MAPTTFSQRLIDDAGPVDGYWHIAPTLLSAPSVLKGDKFDQVFKYEPWSHKSTQNMLEHHPVAVWRNLTVHVSSQAGVFGRMVEFYGGWSAEGATSPSTVQEMAQLRGAFSRVVGGSADPGVLHATIPCEFDGTVSDALKAQYNNGVRAVFYYCFTEIEIVSSPPKAPRIKLEFVGKYDVFGNFGR